jgi:TPR repeat protein
MILKQFFTIMFIAICSLSAYSWAQVEHELSPEDKAALEPFYHIRPEDRAAFEASQLKEKQEVDRQDHLVAKANELISAGQFDQAIVLLEPELAHASYKIASTHYMAYDKQKKLREYLSVAKPVANSGNGYVAFFVSVALEELLSPDIREVERYLIIADTQDLDLATKQLGDIYYSGRRGYSTSGATLITRDPQKAGGYYEKCMESNVVGMDCRRGVAFTLLENFIVDKKRALSILEKDKAYGSLWSVYYFGIGVDVDRKKSEHYRKLSTQTNFSENEMCGNNLTSRISDFIAGKADGGRMIALELSPNTEMLNCFPIDPKNYVLLLRKSAEAGYAGSAIILARELEDGSHVPKDYVSSYYFYSIAASEGKGSVREESLGKLQLLETKISPVALEEAQKKFRDWQHKRDTR